MDQATTLQIRCYHHLLGPFVSRAAVVFVAEPTGRPCRRNGHNSSIALRSGNGTLVEDSEAILNAPR
jgi:hypothetical protein